MALSHQGLPFLSERIFPESGKGTGVHYLAAGLLRPAVCTRDRHNWFISQFRCGCHGFCLAARPLQRNEGCLVDAAASQTNSYAAAQEEMKLTPEKVHVP